MTVIEVKTVQQYEALQKKAGVLVSHFQADWAPQCKQINEVIKELSMQPDTKSVVYASVMAEELAEVSQRLSITAVPTIILSCTARDGESPKVEGRVDGAKPADVTQLVKLWASKASLLGTPTPSSLPGEDLQQRLTRLTRSAPCMLFMKGDPQQPKCGFSRTTIELLNRHNADYSTFDILTDEEVRQGLKTFSNWPTYPQLYVKGELVGGLDILKTMDADGELAALLPTKKSLDERLKALINTAPLMVFMKGDRNEPKCGFSRTMIQLLNETSLSFETFDILTDEEVRQGLKTFSNWPTYPQVYVKGELIGGLDILKEMHADGTLMSALKGE